MGAGCHGISHIVELNEAKGPQMPGLAVMADGLHRLTLRSPVIYRPLSYSSNPVMS